MSYETAIPLAVATLVGISVLQVLLIRRPRDAGDSFAMRLVLVPGLVVFYVFAYVLGDLFGNGELGLAAIPTAVACVSYAIYRNWKRVAEAEKSSPSKT